MARANARYGFVLRTMAVARAGKSSATMTADAFVFLAATAYFGLATNVSWPRPASSIPATPVISVSGEPFSKRAPSAETICASLIGVLANETDCNRRAGQAERVHEPPRGCEPRDLLAPDPPNRRQQAIGCASLMEISPYGIKRQTGRRNLAKPQKRIGTGDAGSCRRNIFAELRTTAPISNRRWRG